MLQEGWLHAAIPLWMSKYKNQLNLSGEKLSGIKKALNVDFYDLTIGRADPTNANSDIEPFDYSWKREVVKH